jgi:Putative prokaryotic signal transducing protein
MREVLRSNDAVVISFAQAILKELGIANFIADQHISAAEGSIGVFPRRLLVDTDDVTAARRALTEAGLEIWLVGIEEAGA